MVWIWDSLTRHLETPDYMSTMVRDCSARKESTMNGLLRMILLTILATLSLTGCTKSGTDGDPNKPNVVATTMQIGDIVRQLAADRVNLQIVMGPGVNPHQYKPSPSDMGQMKRANLVLYNGLHLEGKMVEILDKSLGDRAKAVTANIPTNQLIRTQGQAHDPHVWFDIALWKLAAQTVADELARIDPAGKDVYQTRLTELLDQLDQLDSYIRQQIRKIPESKRSLITSHDAFAYFGRAYGMKVLGIQGISTESEAGIQDIHNAVDYIVKHQIPAVFIESSVPPQTIDRVKADCEARGVQLSGGKGSGLELYSDAMGVTGEHTGYEVETYLGMYRYNVDTIVRGLTGKN